MVNSSRYALYSSLYEPLQKLAGELEGRMEAGLPMVVVAGQRSGKTEMAKTMAIGRKTFLYCSGINSVLLKDYKETWFDVQRGPTPANHTMGVPDLVIIDEAFWSDDALFMYMYWLGRGIPTLAIGSCCNDMSIWDSYVTHRFATWELCPHVAKADLNNERTANYYTWFRDFASRKPEFAKELAKENTAITVAELIEELKKFPQDAKVYHYDSEWGSFEVSGVEIHHRQDGSVIIL